MELDLLEENQIFGDKRLSIFDKYETRATITDFSVLLGVFVSSTFYTSEGNRTCWWWTKTDDGDDDVRIVCNNGNRDYSIVNRRYIGVRPALPYSSISNIFSNKEKSANGILEVLYGEYPQDIVDENYSRKLESAYNNGSLRTTGKSYTTDSVRYQDTDTSFSARTHAEYEYNGQKFIRFVGGSNGTSEVLSDGREIKKGEIYWVKVEPIIWLVDEEKDIAITKKIIVSGVQFNKERKYKGDFKNTDLYKFMNTYLIKDMFDNVSINKKEDNNKEFVSINNKIKTLRKRIDNIRK